MAKVLSLVAVVALCLIGVPALYAGDAAPAPAPAPAPAAEKASGKVTAVGEKGEVTVEGKADEGKEAPKWTFGTDEKTKVTLNEKEAKVADLKAGDMVDVEYTKDGDKMTASSIAAKREEPKAPDAPK